MSADIAPAKELLARLVAFDTTSHKSNIPIISYIEDYLARYGVRSVRVPTADGQKASLFATIGPSDGGGIALSGHTDVVPVTGQSWESDPFAMVERDGRLYGRGTADDKAGAVAHTSAISAWLKTHGALPVNVKLIIEGEEEVGSDNLEPFLNKYASKVMADAIVLTDTGNFDHETPSITVALRGIVALDVTVRSMDHPLHSGMWGGPVADPVQALAKMIASCTDANSAITGNSGSFGSLSGSTLNETNYRATGGTPPTWTFSGTPSSTQTVMTGLTAPGGASSMSVASRVAHRAPLPHMGPREPSLFQKWKRKCAPSGASGSSRMIPSAPAPVRRSHRARTASTVKSAGSTKPSPSRSGLAPAAAGGGANRPIIFKSRSTCSPGSARWA